MHGVHQSTLEAGQTLRGQAVTVCPTPWTSEGSADSSGMLMFLWRRRRQVLGRCGEGDTGSSASFAFAKCSELKLKLICMSTVVLNDIFNQRAQSQFFLGALWPLAPCQTSWVSPLRLLTTEERHRAGSVKI